MKKIYTLMAAALTFGACSVVMSSCGDDNEPEQPNNPEAPSVKEEMTPTESKQHLEETATEALGLFRPADQQELIELTNFFGKRYGDLSLPENFEFKSTNPKSMMNALGEIGRGNVAAFASAAVTYTYNVNFDKMKGVYKPKGDEWVKVSDSNDIVFQFNNTKQGDAQLTVKVSKEVSNFDFTLTDWDYEYDENGYHEYEEEYIYNVALPHEVNFTLTSEGNKLAEGKVVSSIDVKGHKFALQAETNLMNINARIEAKGSDSKVEQSSAIKVGGVSVVTSSAAVNGKHLCDRDHWEALEDADDEAAYMAGILNSGSASVDVLGRVQFEASISNFTAELIEALDNSYDNYDYNSKDAALNACKKDCGTINQAIKTQFRYNSDTVQGSLFFQPYLSYEESWSGNQYWEYEQECVLKFASDGTTYSFDEYFSKGFGNVTNQWESLIDNYERIWKNVK